MSGELGNKAGDRGARSGAHPALAWLIAGLVALGSLLLALPQVLATWTLTPDAVEHVGIAHNWVEGRGFLDPIVYSYYRKDLMAPAPAPAIRAPVVPLLLALPIALGADLTLLGVVHVIWASLIVAASLLVARRLMPLPAAAAYAIALGWSLGWILFSQPQLTEVTSVGVLLLAVALSPLALRSKRGALLLAAITVLGWLTRPNLGLILPAVALAALFERGFRGTLRCSSLWVYGLSFLVLHQGLQLAMRATYGIGLYEHYGLLTEVIEPDEGMLYQKVYVGWLLFVQEHASQIAAGIVSNLRLYAWHIFVYPTYLQIGWLALPGIFYVCTRRGPGFFELKVAALFALGLSATAVGSYGSFDPVRLALPAVACAGLPAMRLLSDAGLWIARGRGDPESRVPAGALVRGIPLWIVLIAFALQLAPFLLSRAHLAWTSYARHGTLRPGNIRSGLPEGEWGQAARAFCRDIDSDARVAAPDPWTLYLYCGNASAPLPPDLDSVDWVDRYIDEQRPGYLISDGREAYAMLANSPRLERVAVRGDHMLYRVLDPVPESRPWRAPAPLASLGAPPPRQPEVPDAR